MTQSEIEIIRGLKNRDGKVTRDFFFHKCRPLFNGIIKDFFNNDADYDELINCLYEYLMEDDARRLDSFHGGDNGEAIYAWMRKISRNFFCEKKNRDKVVGNTAQNPLVDENMPGYSNIHIIKEAEMDIPVLLDQLRMKRDREIIIKAEIEEKSYDEISREMGLSKQDLYRIHNRAMERLKKAARIALDADDTLCAIRCEQYILDCSGIHKSIDELMEYAYSRGWLKHSGVCMEDLGRIPESLGLKVEHGLAGIKEIENALIKGKQVLVAVDGGELIGNKIEEKAEDILVGEIADHCVVVLTCDVSENEISLFDPAYGDVPLTLSVDRFCDAWADSGNLMVTVSK